MTTTAARLILSRPPEGAFGEALRTSWWRGFACGAWASMGSALLGAGMWYFS